MPLSIFEAVRVLYHCVIVAEHAVSVLLISFPALAAHVPWC